MRKYVILMLCIIAIQSYGQSFEGTIVWGSPSGKDPAITMKVKGANMATVINGGMMQGMEMWFMNNRAKVMRVMRPQKMFMVVPAEAIAAAASAEEPGKFAATGETSKVLNYTCTKYTGEIKVHGVATTVSIWATTEIKDDLKVLAYLPITFNNPQLPEGVKGVPMKIETATSVMVVTEVKPEKLADDLFTLPADFKEMGK